MKLASPVAAQIESAENANPRFNAQYSLLIRSFARAAEPHEVVLQDFVKSFLHKTRSEKEVVQLAAIEALQQMWEAGIPAALAVHSAECMPFLVEALEHGGEIERAAKELLAKMNDTSLEGEGLATDISESSGESGDA